MRIYKGLLRNGKVHELAEQLQGLPEISVNLANLQQAGLPVDRCLNSHPMVIIMLMYSSMQGKQPFRPGSVRCCSVCCCLQVPYNRQTQ